MCATLTEEDARLRAGAALPRPDQPAPTPAPPAARAARGSPRHAAPPRRLRDLPADVALYWADGTRTLAEILDLTELNPRPLRKCFGAVDL